MWRVRSASVCSAASSKYNASKPSSVYCTIKLTRSGLHQAAVTKSMCAFPDGAELLKSDSFTDAFELLPMSIGIATGFAGGWTVGIVVVPVI